MTLWRPPRSQAERTMRAIRSMQSGSIDGRIVSAYPVKSELDDEEYDEYSELDDADDGDGTTSSDGDDLSLKPWTDYFTIKNIGSVHNFALNKTPWVQEKMNDETRNYASVHLYWNGVFQRDVSYTLDNSVITIFDPERKFRESDTITVKYFYSQETVGVIDENMYRMKCWFSGHDTMRVGLPGYYVFFRGVLAASPLGSNFGTVTTVATRWYNSQLGGGWESKFQLPRGQKIPVGDDVTGVTWRVSFDPGADIHIGVGSRAGWSFKGNDYGDIFCHKTNCGLGDDQCPNSKLGLVLDKEQVGPFNPSYGPIGGQVFLSGQPGKDLARQMNGNANSTTAPDDWGVRVERQMPYYEGIIEYNSGCAYGVGGDGENTLYGKASYEKATYQVKIGVTATVVRK